MRLLPHPAASPPDPGEHFRVSGDGSTVAFSTDQALVPGDVNGGSDLYEWHNGSLGLLTDGVSGFPTALSRPRAEVVYVDATGANVMFTRHRPRAA